MSVKRTATTELNHDNWDQEDPAEHDEMGTYKVASKDVLEKRVIRTAKRRSRAPGDEPNKSVFSGFGGFNKSQPSSFDFLANLTNGNKNTNGASTKSDTMVTSSLFSSKPAASTGLFGASSTGFGSNPLQNSPLFTSTAKTDIPTMTFTGSKADSTSTDSPFKMQSVSSSADTAKPSPQVSSTIFGVSSTSTNQKPSIATNSFKKPVSSSNTALQNSSGIATQSNSNKTESNNELETDKDKARNKYYSKLKGLNESVASWISKHVEKTPLCFLTPIFKDYENYLKDIKEEYEAAKEDLKKANLVPSQNKSDSKPTSGSTVSPFLSSTPSMAISNSPNKTTNITTPSKGFSFGIMSTTAVTPPSSSPLSTNSTNTMTAPNKAFSFGVTSTPAEKPNQSAFTTNTSSTPTKGFSFGISTTSASTPTNSSPFANTSSTSSKPMFGMTTSASTPTNSSPFANTSSTASKPMFGMTTSASPTDASKVTDASAPAPFSFGLGSNKPFSFGSQVQQSTEPSKTEENEDDEPPKVEYTPVVEENSVFDKRCKIFVKKDGNFADKGVGTMYIKKIEESGKHQLLVRANTNLGTVLLNLILSSAIPIQRMGKNNVMLVCIPTPDTKPPPTPILIRVKTGEEADDLLETLNKYKS